MALIRYPSEAPVRSALIDRAAMVSLRWLQWFQLVGDRIGAWTILDTPFDPVNIGAGGLTTVTVAVPGATPGDFVIGVSLAPMSVGGVPTSAIRTMADVIAADTVAVSLLNLSGGAVDLDAGTLRLKLERVA